MKFETSDNLKIYFKQIKNSTPLSKEQEMEIGKRIANGDSKAIAELVKANLKIVVTIANNHIGQGLSIDDLIQEGNIGLYEAAMKFSPNPATKFVTYASYWIRKRINEAVAQKGRVVRLPHNQEYAIYKAKMAGEDTPNLHPIELDSLVGEDADETFADRLLGNAPDVEKEHVIEHENFIIRKSLSTLKERDREIVKMYFGIGCDYAVPSDIIAKRLGITQIRVCQIVKISIEKMKATC